MKSTLRIIWTKGQDWEKLHGCFSSLLAPQPRILDGGQESLTSENDEEFSRCVDGTLEESQFTSACWHVSASAYGLYDKEGYFKIRRQL